MPGFTHALLLVAVPMILLAGTSLFAQDEASSASPAASPGKPQIAIIDLDEIVRRIGRDKVIIQAVQASDAASQKDLQALHNRLQQELQETMKAMQPDLSDVEKQQLVAVRTEAETKMKTALSEAQEKSRNLRTRLIQEVKDEIRPFARAVAQKHGLVVTLVKNDNVFDFDPTIEITSQVAEAMIAAGKVHKNMDEATEPAPLKFP